MVPPPLQVPFWAVSSLPSPVLPLMVGGEVFEGVAATRAVAAIAARATVAAATPATASMPSLWRLRIFSAPFSGTWPWFPMRSYENALRRKNCVSGLYGTTDTSVPIGVYGQILAAVA